MFFFLTAALRGRNCPTTLDCPLMVGPERLALPNGVGFFDNISQAFHEVDYLELLLPVSRAPLFQRGITQEGPRFS